MNSFLKFILCFIVIIAITKNTVVNIPDDACGTDGTGGNCEISTASPFSNSSIAESICW